MVVESLLSAKGWGLGLENNVPEADLARTRDTALMHNETLQKVTGGGSE